MRDGGRVMQGRECAYNTTRVKHQELLTGCLPDGLPNTGVSNRNSSHCGIADYTATSEQRFTVPMTSGRESPGVALKAGFHWQISRDLVATKHEQHLALETHLQKILAPDVP
jgi:hypothetical protein